MKMIEVFDLMAEGKIKEGTKLKIGYKIYDYINTESDDYSFVNQEDDGGRFLEDNELITTDFLNLDVELIPPKPKKYYLRLDKDDSFSYINMTMYAAYEAAGKDEFVGYNKTKFTQEEIDGSMLLKFIEQHGIKEEVKDNETD